MQTEIGDILLSAGVSYFGWKIVKNIFARIRER